MSKGGGGDGADLYWSPGEDIIDVYGFIADGIKHIYEYDGGIADPYINFTVNAFNELERHIQAVYTDIGLDTPQAYILLLAALDKNNFRDISNNFMILSNYIKTSFSSPSALYEVNAYKNLSNFLDF